MQGDKERTVKIYIAIIVIGIIGSWLRFRNLGADSLWLDEAASWLQSKGSLAELISATAHDNYPPLHNLLLFAAINISGGDTEWILRAPSALLGSANIVAVYWLGTVIDGPITGVLAAAILATSGFHIYYSQEARMYALLALTATLYAAAAFYFVKSPTYARTLLLAACGVALAYSHPFGILNWIVIAIGISAIILWASDFPRFGLLLWVIANAAIVLCFLPWALILLQRASAIAGGFWAPYPTAEVIYTVVYTLVGGRLVAAGLLLGAVVALCSNFRVSVVLVLWAIVPVGLALIESLFLIPIFVARYFIGTLPALATVSALGMAHLLNRHKWPTTVVAAISMVAIVIGNLRYVTAPRDDWRAAAAYLHQHLQKSDCVLLYPGYNVNPLRYYLRTPFCAFLPTSLAEIDVQAIKVPRIFAVFSHVKTSELDRVRAILSSFGREVEHFDPLRIQIIEYQR